MNNERNEIIYLINQLPFKSQGEKVIYLTNFLDKLEDGIQRDIPEFSLYDYTDIINELEVRIEKLSILAQQINARSGALNTQGK